MPLRPLLTCIVSIVALSGAAAVSLAADTSAADSTTPATAPAATEQASAAEPVADAEADEALPVVVLIGDSIRMGYAPAVTELLKGKARVVAAKENGGDSQRVLDNLDEWAISQDPAVVHFNCGLHDLKQMKDTGAYQVPVENYEKNLRTIVDRLQQETKARLIFATTTPIRDAQHAKRKGNYDRREADVERYNAVAVRVMKEKGIEIDDLHAVVTDAGVGKVQRSDGTHYSPAGCKTLGAAVAEHVAKDLPSR